jgi:hypothetical protein
MGGKRGGYSGDMASARTMEHRDLGGKSLTGGPGADYPILA